MGRPLVAVVEATRPVIPVVGFCTLTRHDLGDRLVRSINRPVEHLVVVDNCGKGDYTPPANEHVGNVWVLPMPYGIGLTGAWNLIVKATPYAPYWVLVNDDAWFSDDALDRIAAEVDTDALNFCHVDQTPWAAPVFGEGMVARAGLYDEAFYPVYFDDDDLERRVRHAGVPVKQLSARIHHEPMTTRQNFLGPNQRTWAANEARHKGKIEAEDYTVHGWDLTTRRELRWD